MVQEFTFHYCKKTGEKHGEFVHLRGCPSTRTNFSFLCLVICKRKRRWDRFSYYLYSCFCCTSLVCANGHKFHQKITRSNALSHEVVRVLLYIDRNPFSKDLKHRNAKYRIRIWTILFMSVPRTNPADFLA